MTTVYYIHFFKFNTEITVFQLTCDLIQSCMSITFLLQNNVTTGNISMWAQGVYMQLKVEELRRQIRVPVRDIDPISL